MRRDRWLREPLRTSRPNLNWPCRLFLQALQLALVTSTGFTDPATPRRISDQVHASSSGHVDSALATSKQKGAVSHQRKRRDSPQQFKDVVKGHSHVAKHIHATRAGSTTARVPSAMDSGSASALAEHTPPKSQTATRDSNRGSSPGRSGPLPSAGPTNPRLKPSLIFLALLASGVLGLVLWFTRRRGASESSLAQLTAREIAKRRPKPTLRQRFALLIESTLVPSRENALRLSSLAAGVLALAWWLSRPGSPKWLKWDALDSVGVTSGLMGVAIALTILVAELLRDGDPIGRGRAALRASLAYPLLAGSIVVLAAGAVLPSSKLLSIAPAAVLAIVASIGVHQLLALLLRTDRLASAQTAVIRADFRSASESVLADRVGNNILVDRVSRLSRVDLLPGLGWLPDRQAIERILARSTGTITDIDLRELQKLNAAVANATATAQDSDTVAQTTLPTESRTQSSRIARKPAMLLIRFQESVRPGTVLMVLGPNVRLTDANRRKLQAILDRMLRIEDQAPGTIRYQNLVDDMGSRLTSAVRSGDRSGVRLGTEHFHFLAEEYMQLLREFGASFDEAAARAEEQALGGPLISVEAPARTLQSVLEIGSEQADRTILIDLLGTVFGIAARAIDERELLLFRQQLWVIETLMAMSYRDRVPENNKRLIRDRAITYCADLGGVYLDLLLEAKPGEPSLAFATAALRSIQDCLAEEMRAAARHGDLDSLRRLTRTLARLGPRDFAGPMRAHIEADEDESDA